MTVTSVSQWSTIAAQNVEIDGSNIDEGCPPGNLNNMGRAIMAQGKAKFDSTDAVLAVGTIAAPVGTRIYATRALLYADLVPADGLYALVRDDPTPTLNGLYWKVGATGTGSWSGPSSLFSGALSAFVAPSVTAAAASATSAATSATQAAVSAGSAGAAADTARAIGGGATGSAAAAAVSAAAAASWATASAASAASSASAEAGTLAAISGATITTSITIAPLTVAALQALTIPADGTTVFLRAPGRKGTLTYSTANLSAQVTADPYQGLYYAPASAPTGASGAWVRQVENDEYRTSWWAPEALGNNAHLALNTIDGLLPSTGCHLIFPPNTTYTTSGRVLFTKDGIVIRGAGYSSWLQRNTAAADFHVLWSCGSHCKVLNLRISGKEASLFANNPACLIIQSQYGLGGPAGTVLQRTTSDVEIAGVTIENTSLGIALAGSADTDGARNNGVIVVPSNNVKIHHCSITTNMHGIEVFGSDNFDIHDNVISASANTPSPNFSGCVRILGSQEGEVHDNNLTGPGHDRTDRAIFYLSAASFTAGARRASKNLMLRNNKATGAFKFCFVEECQGDLVIDGNNWAESIAATTTNVAVQITLSGITDGLLPVADRVYIRNNTFEGVQRYLDYSTAGGGTKHIQSRDNSVIGNAAGVTATGRICNAVFPGAKLTEFIRDSFLMNDGGGREFAFDNAGGLKLRVVGCTLPEQTTTNSLFDSDGTGTIIKTLGNTGEDATLGSNNRYVVGTFALVQ